MTNKKQHAAAPKLNGQQVVFHPAAPGLLKGRLNVVQGQVVVPAQSRVVRHRKGDQGGVVPQGVQRAHQILNMGGKILQAPLHLAVDGLNQILPRVVMGRLRDGRHQQRRQGRGQKHKGGVPQIDPMAAPAHGFHLPCG